MHQAANEEVVERQHLVGMLLAQPFHVFRWPQANCMIFLLEAMEEVAAASLQVALASPSSKAEKEASMEALVVAVELATRAAEAAAATQAEAAVRAAEVAVASCAPMASTSKERSVMQTTAE